MIIFSDLHLKEDTEKTVLEQVFPGLLSAVVNDPDKTLACLGDFFHVRYRIPVHLQNRVKDFLEVLEYQGIQLFLLPGNHDQISVMGENALEVFGRFPNVTVFTYPAWNDYGYWIPYRKQASDIADALKGVSANATIQRPPVLFMHHGIRGAYMNSQIRDTTGLPVEDLKAWTVLCGHYHVRQQLGTVRYIGSPYQITAGEAGQDKGYAIWDTKNLTLQWVNTDWGKRYHNIGLVSDTELDLTAIRSGDEVRATTPLGVDPTVLGKILERLGAKAVITPQLQVGGARLPVASHSSIADYAKAYVDQFADNLDKDRLMTIYKGLSGN